MNYLVVLLLYLHYNLFIDFIHMIGLIDPTLSMTLSATVGHTFYATRTSDGIVVDYFTASAEPYFMKPNNNLENCQADKVRNDTTSTLYPMHYFRIYSVLILCLNGT